MVAPLPLDHLVYAVPDLGEAVEHFAKHLGVRAAFGGRHGHLGSHNALLPMTDMTYLELIALDPENPDPPMPPPFGLAELSEARLVTFAVRSEDIEADTAQAKDRGYDAGLTLPATRTTPEGVTLEWKLTVRADRFGDGLVPFVIDWEKTPHPSRPDEDIPRCTLSAFEGIHPEPEVVVDALAALGVGLDVRVGAPAGLRATLVGPEGSLELN